MRIKRQNFGSRSLGTALIVILGAMLASAQEFRGVISGQVTDPSGAVVPNALIEAVREGTQQPYTAQSNGTGIFSIPSRGAVFNAFKA